MSTIVAFIPDDTIFDTTVANYSKRNLAYTQVVLDKFYGKKVSIYIDGNLANAEFEPYKFEFIKKVEVKGKEDRIKAAAFYITFECDQDLSVQDESGSVNSLVVNRGLHIRYAKSAYIEALRDEYNITHNYVNAGLKITVICMCGEVDFNSQTKGNGRGRNRKEIAMAGKRNKTFGRTEQG
jgi:hypothetical protein